MPTWTSVSLFRFSRANGDAVMFEYTLEHNGWYFVSLCSLYFKKIRKELPISHLCVWLWYYLHLCFIIIKTASWLSPLILSFTNHQRVTSNWLWIGLYFSWFEYTEFEFEVADFHTKNLQITSKSLKLAQRYHKLLRSFENLLTYNRRLTSTDNPGSNSRFHFKYGK